MTQFVRPRFSAVVIAVAMVLAAAIGGSLVGRIGLADAVVDSGDKPVTVNIDLVRIRDTRTVFGGPIGGPGQKLGAGATEVIKVADTNGIPADAKAVCINLTVLDSTGETFVSAFGAALPAGQIPKTSTVNPGPGDTVVNGVVVPLDATGSMRVYNNVGSVNFFIDVSCYTVDHNHADREPKVVHSTDANLSDFSFTPEATTGPTQTIETDRAGYLDVRMPINATVDCAPNAAAGRIAYLTVDGTALPSSFQFVPQGTTTLTALLQGVTDTVVAAGTHTVGVGWSCVGANTASGVSFSANAIASAIVLPG